MQDAIYEVFLECLLKISLTSIMLNQTKFDSLNKFARTIEKKSIEKKTFGRPQIELSDYLFVLLVHVKEEVL